MHMFLTQKSSENWLIFLSCIVNKNVPCWNHYKAKDQYQYKPKDHNDHKSKKYHVHICMYLLTNRYKNKAFLSYEFSYLSSISLM